MKKRRLLSLLLVISLGLSACGSRGKNEKQESETNKNAVFREENDVFALGEGDISQFIVVGDRIYVEQYEYSGNLSMEREEAVTEVSDFAALEENVEEDTEGVSEEVTEEDAEEETMESIIPQDMEMGADTMASIRKITGLSMDGEVKSQFRQKMEQNCGTGNFTADSEGNIYSILYQYATYEGNDTTDKVFLVANDANGAEKWKLHLNENIAEGEYFFVNALHCDDKNQILVDTLRGVEVYDKEGKPVKLIERQQGSESRLFKIRDNKFALVSSDGSTAGIQTLDVQSGILGEKITLPFYYYRYQISNGKVYDLYLTDDYGVYGYNLGDLEITKIMDYISSDFSYGSLSQTGFADEKTFFAVYYGEAPVMAKFTKVPPEEVVDKIEIIVGCYYLDGKVKQKLIEFNKKNQGYRLNILDYSVYDTMNDYTQGLTRLNTDIISGKVPDVMLLNTQMPFESYVSKGIFADLNSFLEKDEEIKKEDLLSNILSALSSEDGLYKIAPSFTVTTFVGKTADVGPKPGWTMEQALEVLKSKPEGTQLLSEMTGSNFLYYANWICGEQYVNWNTGKCYFDSEGFIQVLEFAKTLPKEIDYSTVTDEESYWQEMELQYRNGKTLLNVQYLSSFRDYNYTKQAVFGEDITLVGFPTDQGMGAGINFNTPMAISALSKHQDIAWDFVKTFLSAEYQDSLEYDFPIRLDSLKKLEEKAWEKPYYLDEQGNKQEYDDYFYLNGVEIPVEPMTPQDTAKVMEYLQSVDSQCVYNETLNNIIMEETAGFFEGQKTAQEVAKIIQSRAKIYVSENS